MFDYQKKVMSPKHEGSRDMQVLRSIEGQSAVSLETADTEQLMMKFLLLSIEFDRKDTIIRELQQLIEGDESRRIIEELSIQCTKYEMQIKSLNETVKMLKESISIVEAAKSKDMLTSMTQFNQDLEMKVTNLQNKLRRTQEQKIDLEQQLSKIKINQTMEGYKSLQNEHNEKNRIRQLQTLLVAERTKVDVEKKAVFEKNILLDEMKAKIVEQQNRQHLIVNQYEQKLRTFHQEIVFNESLKKSQIASNEERLNATTQQITGLNDQIRRLNMTIDQLRDVIQSKQRQVNRVITDSRGIESKLIRVETELKDVTQRYQVVSQELNRKDKELGEKAAIAQKLTNDIEEIRFIFNSKGEEAEHYSEEVQRLRTEIIELQSQIKSQNLEIRKLKRKPPVLCQGCQVREMGSSTLINSQKSIKGLDIGNIIDQTQKLFQSNKRIESMINGHNMGYESSVHLFPSRTIEM